MYMTTPRPVQPGDPQKAAEIVAAAKAAMAPYEDYQKALAAGYRIFLPNVPQPQYHFTQDRIRARVAQPFRSFETALAAVYQNAGRWLQTGWGDVHRPRGCE